MTRRRLVPLTLLAVAALWIVVEWVVRPAINPLRQSPEAIAASLLEKIPSGSTRTEVEAWADAQGLRGGGILRGTASQDGGDDLHRVLGEYNSYGAVVAVYVRWVFDKDGRLQTVEVK